MTTKTVVEPMPLEELRERLRYGARSQVSTLEPVDLASMRLTVEQLVEVRRLLLSGNEMGAVVLAGKVKP